LNIRWEGKVIGEKNVTIFEIYQSDRPFKSPV